jgi:hypothetical protein
LCTELKVEEDVYIKSSDNLNIKLNAVSRWCKKNIDGRGKYMLATQCDHGFCLITKMAEPSTL